MPTTYYYTTLNNLKNSVKILQVHSGQAGLWWEKVKCLLDV